MKYTTFVGLDVHAKLISVAIMRKEMKEPLYMGQIPNEPEAIRQLVKKLGHPKDLRFCYEAGPCGYVIYRQLHQMGISCLVAAPSLIPTQPGVRVKTDKRDAKKLAKLFMFGELTPAWVPDEHQEAMRDLIRAREDAHQDLLRKRQQLSKFLLRIGQKPSTQINRWTLKYRRWLESLQLSQPQQIVLNEYIQAMDEAESRVQRLEKELMLIAEKFLDRKILQAIQGLRGIAFITAVTLIAEIGDFTRFEKATQLMSYSGIVPGEYSSGEHRRRGSITKAGNAHVRRVIVEAAHHYRHQPSVGEKLKKRLKGLSPEIQAISWKAQNRLNRKYRKLLARGKSSQVAVTAVARELLGFIWSVAQQVAKENGSVA